MVGLNFIRMFIFRTLYEDHEEDDNIIIPVQTDSQQQQQSKGFGKLQVLLFTVPSLTSVNATHLQIINIIIILLQKRTSSYSMHHRVIQNHPPLYQSIPSRPLHSIRHPRRPVQEAATTISCLLCFCFLLTGKFRRPPPRNSPSSGPPISDRIHSVVLPRPTIVCFLISFPCLLNLQIYTRANAWHLQMLLNPPSSLPLLECHAMSSAASERETVGSTSI